jgi:hypothetical protein
MMKCACLRRLIEPEYKLAVVEAIVGDHASVPDKQEPLLIAMGSCTPERWTRAANGYLATGGVTLTVRPCGDSIRAANAFLR